MDIEKLAVKEFEFHKKQMMELKSNAGILPCYMGIYEVGNDNVDLRILPIPEHIVSRGVAKNIAKEILMRPASPSILMFFSKANIKYGNREFKREYFNEEAEVLKLKNLMKNNELDFTEIKALICICETANTQYCDVFEFTEDGYKELNINGNDFKTMNFIAPKVMNIIYKTDDKKFSEN